MDYEKCINSIQALAKKQGISMKFLCDQLEKRRSFLSEVRLGKDRIHDNEVEVIASILNTTPAYLRGETDDPMDKEASEDDWVYLIKINPKLLGLVKNIVSMSDEHVELMKHISDMSEDEAAMFKRVIMSFKERK